MRAESDDSPFFCAFLAGIFIGGGSMKKIHPYKLEIVQRGLNQLDVAEAAHMSASRLNRILNGRGEPRDYELKNLRRALGLDREARAA